MLSFRPSLRPVPAAGGSGTTPGCRSRRGASAQGAKKSLISKNAKATNSFLCVTVVGACAASEGGAGGSERLGVGGGGQPLQGAAVKQAPGSPSQAWSLPALPPAGPAESRLFRVCVHVCEVHSRLASLATSCARTMPTTRRWRLL